MNSNYNSESSLLDDSRVNTIKYINISENEKANREILKRSSWWHSSAVIIAEIMGTGVMGLPFAAAGLGWILGMSDLTILIDNYRYFVLFPWNFSKSKILFSCIW